MRVWVCVVSRDTTARPLVLLSCRRRTGDNGRDVLGLLLRLDFRVVRKPDDQREGAATDRKAMALKSLDRARSIVCRGHADQRCPSLAGGVSLVQYPAHYHLTKR